MGGPYRVPWQKLWDYLAALGTASDRDGLFGIALAELGRILPCDEAYSFFMDASPAGPRVSSLTVGIPEEAVDAYFHRYFAIDWTFRSLRPGMRYFEQEWNVRSLDRDEFTIDCMRRTIDVSFTAGLPIGRAGRPPSMVFMIARKGGPKLDDLDRRILALLRPHLENWFNVMNRLPLVLEDHYSAAELAAGSRLLSRREAEVAALLCRRYRPAEIATRLLVSPRTVERHVENIYAKLGVRNRAGMLRRLLGPAETPREGGRPRPRREPLPSGVSAKDRGLLEPLLSRGPLLHRGLE